MDLQPSREGRPLMPPARTFRRAVVAGLLCIAATALGLPELGAPAPAFAVVSPDGVELSLASLRGGTFALFYETRETVEQNREFKKEFGRLRDESEAVRAGVRIAAVVNASAANVLTRGVWRSKLRENARREGLTIYADWSGRMAADYAMMPEASNVLIVDAQGVVRFARAGPLSETDRRAALELLRALAAERTQR